MPVRIAVLVGNDLTGDSRVHKICASASELGYEVFAVATPLTKSNSAVAKVPYKIVRTTNAPTAQTRTISVKKLVAVGLGVVSLVQRKLHIDPRRITARALRIRINRQTALMLERLQEIAPDLIHANDPDTLPAAVEYKLASARPIGVVYDSHEYVRGVHRPSHGWNDVMLGLESKYIHQADVVVTVSPEIAALLQADYNLARTPSVIVNLPNRPRPDDGNRTTLRDDLGLSKETPLGVYTGVSAEARGLDLIPELLHSLPDLHFCLVTRENSYLTALRRRATDLKVIERLHVLPYVAPDEVSRYISDADFGLSPVKHHVNHELACPTKLYEYLQAGLPIVTSDVEASKTFVNDFELGAVFVADDARDCAAAVQRVLGNRDLLRARLSGEMLNQYSWEFQQSLLAEIYESARGVNA